jgi:predicted GIY-YIG superfamily endonuclease
MPIYTCRVFYASLLVLVAVSASAWGLQESSADAEIDSLEAKSEFEKNPVDKSVIETVVAAFKKTHDGFSSDEVLLQDALQDKFIGACRQKLPDTEVETLNWVLLNLRKQGKLKDIETTKQNRVELEDVRHVAEIVARSVQDAKKISVDRAMCNPESRKSFDELARTFDPEIDVYRVRKAAFQLRKARQLKPELITRVADWGRVVTGYHAKDLVKDLSKIPEEPGIYIFSDKEGYLYIGESDNLRRRLTSHLDDSDRKSLANYLKEKKVENISIEIHTFEKGSRIKELAIRRAYESELIRSRNPRFNIRP